jgi:hypothetical protein
MAGKPIRTVSLELLRKGPPHNQLLSPLTDYLGIANQSHAGTIHFPYEHGTLQRRLASLCYPVAAAPAMSSDGQREFAARVRERAERERQATLLELSASVTEALNAVPGLPGQLAQKERGADLVHLDVVLSAAELAMLPFEVMGPVGQGQVEPGRFLLLAGNPSVCLTRRVRGVDGECARWTRPPKILFVASSAGGAIPYDDHLAALQRALDPWVPFDAKDTARYVRELAAHLTVLEKPSIADIAEACEKNEFTHVHVLAHGVPLPVTVGAGIGVALNSERGTSEPHVVTGDQFASALQRDGHEKLGPVLVSLAMCDSGAIQEVMFTGASFAHAIHRSGIPVVIASQFPLRFDGSTLCAEALFPALLRGEDPRHALVNIRSRLHAHYGDETHDWASLVVYAALPTDIDQQLERFRYDQARRALDAALDDIDRRLATGGDDVPPSDEVEKHIRKVGDALPSEGEYRIEALGLRAAALKRVAHSYFVATRAAEERAACMEESKTLLVAAKRLYVRAMREGMRHRPNERVQQAATHWVLTQTISLKLILDDPFLLSEWEAAQLSASIDSEANDLGDVVVWGRSSLVELALLRAWHESLSGAPGAPTQVETWVDKFKLLARSMIDSAPNNLFAVSATARQIRRYVDWWWSEAFYRSPGATVGRPPTHAVFEAVREVVKELEAYAR